MSPRFTRQSQGTLLRKSVQSLSAHTYGAITLYGGAFQNTSASPRRERPIPYTTFAPARRYSGNPNWFLFLPLLRCFSSGGSRSSRSGGRSRQEVLFGDPRIEDCVRLPGAYRSLPRPSSAPKPSHPTGSVVYQQISRSHGWSRKSMHGIIENLDPNSKGSFSSPSFLDHYLVGNCTG